MLLKNKDQEKKSMGLGNMVSALCGVTEPTIYSIALTNIRLFAAGMIGGGVAGGILGSTRWKNVRLCRRWNFQNSSNDQSKRN